MNNIALEGMTVLDLSRVVAGPYATMMLGDMGARVIRIESPINSDSARIYTPIVGGESGYYLTINRNKESITLNLKTEQGKDILRKLIQKADVFVENFRPGVIKKLGFSYEEVKRLNPAMVYASISGFGQQGPYATLPGYDIVAQAMGGLMEATGEPNGPPLRTAATICDIVAGMNAAIGILAAYSRSRISGLGQYIDISLVDSIISCLCTRNYLYLLTGENPLRLGNYDDLSCPYGGYLCRDGYIVIGCAQRPFFEQLTQLMGQPELQRDPRFASHTKCAENRKDLEQIVEGWTRTLTVQEALHKLQQHQIPCGPVYNTEQMVNDPHIGGVRNMFPEMKHPKAGKVRVTGCPIKMSDTPTDIVKPAPLLGEHTHSVLTELLGLQDSTINTLKKQNII